MTNLFTALIVAAIVILVGLAFATPWVWDTVRSLFGAATA